MYKVRKSGILTMSKKYAGKFVEITFLEIESIYPLQTKFKKLVLATTTSFAVSIGKTYAGMEPSDIKVVENDI